MIRLNSFAGKKARKQNKMKKRFEIIVISAFGRQAELPGTQLIYSLLKGFHDNNFVTHLVTPDLPFVTELDLSEFNVHIIEKGFLQKLTSTLLSGVERFLQKRKGASRVPLKPAYRKGSRLMLYYTFFFYSKQLLPLYKTYKHVKKLSLQLIRDNIKPIIITSVAPGSYLFVGYLLKRHFKDKIIWIANYQDPLENNPLLSYPESYLLRLADNLAFRYADAITAPEKVITKTLISTAKARNIDITERIYLLKQGITPKKIPSKPVQPYTIIYGGTIYLAMLPGLNALLESIKESNNFKFIYAGFTPEVVKKTAAKVKLEKEKYVVYDLLPKQEFENLVASSSIVVVFGTFHKNYVVPGSKIYSFLAYDKPILIISPKTKELIEIAHDAGGVYVTEANEREIKNTLEEIVKEINSKLFFRHKEFFEKRSHKQMVKDFISEFFPEALENPLYNSQHNKL